MVSRWVVMSGGALALAVVAAALAEATFALGHLGSISDDVAHRPRATATPLVTPVPTAVSPTPLASSTPMITPVAVVSKAVTNGFVHFRQSNSLNAPILMDLNAGTTVELMPYQDVQWQQVRYQGTVGYIHRSYLVY